MAIATFMRKTATELDAADAADDLAVVAELRLRVRRNGAMSVEGCIADEAYALAMLANADDTIRRHHATARLNAGQALVTPAHDAPRVTL